MKKRHADGAGSRGAPYNEGLLAGLKGQLDSIESLQREQLRQSFRYVAKAAEMDGALKTHAAMSPRHAHAGNSSPAAAGAPNGGGNGNGGDVERKIGRWVVESFGKSVAWGATHPVQALAFVALLFGGGGMLGSCALTPERRTTYASDAPAHPTPAAPLPAKPIERGNP